MQYLLDQGLYESQSEAQVREDVLGELDQMIKSWVRRVTEVMCMGEHAVAEATAKIFTFGSYRLGVHGPGQSSLQSLWQVFKAAVHQFVCFCLFQLSMVLHQALLDQLRQWNFCNLCQRSINHYCNLLVPLLPAIDTVNLAAVW